MMNTSSTSAPSDGSRTITLQDSQPGPDEGRSLGASREPSSASGLLQLRGGPGSRPRVVWREDVVDNENMGKRSSKSTAICLEYCCSADRTCDLVCCIYHKARKFDESSSEESSSDDDSDDSAPHEHPRSHCRHRQPHTSRSRHRAGDNDGTLEEDSGNAEIHELSSDDEPNAYERVPRRKKIKRKETE